MGMENGECNGKQGSERMFKSCGEHVGNLMKNRLWQWETPMVKFTCV